VFLDPQARTFYADWPRAGRNTVAGFRVLHGATPDDPRVQHVLAELTRRSAEFLELWQRQEVRGKSEDDKTFCHPIVSELTLHMQAFDVRAAPGQQLVVYLAEPGTDSARAITRLRDASDGSRVL